MSDLYTPKHPNRVILKTLFIVVGVMMLPFSLISLIKRGFNSQNSYSFVVNADIPAAYSQGGEACQGFDPADPTCCSNPST